MIPCIILGDACAEHLVVVHAHITFWSQTPETGNDIEMFVIFSVYSIVEGLRVTVKLQQ